MYSGAFLLLSGASPRFTPASLAGLSLWLDPTFGLFQETTGASATTPATADGDPVGTWRARTNQYLTAPSSSARPTLRIVSGRPYVVFDGVDDILSEASGAYPLATSTYLTGSQFVGSSFSRLVSLGGNTTGVEFYRASGNPAALQFDKSGTVSIGTSTPTYSSDVRRVYGYTLTTAALAFFVNGSSVAGTSSANTYSGNGVSLGAKRNATSFFPARIGPSVLYSRVLSASEIARVSGVLA